MTLISTARPPDGDAAAPAGAVPASPVQEMLWRQDRRQAEAVGNLPCALAVDGPLDPALLARAFNDVVARHAVLRTTLADAGALVVQRVAENLVVPLPLVDLRLLPAESREAHAAQLARADAANRFGPGPGPLLRAQLLQLGAQRHILVLVFHRAICDRSSAPILLRELATAYEARRQGREPSLPPLPYSFAEHAARLREPSPEQEAAIAWWRARFAGPPESPVLPEFLRGAETRAAAPVGRVERLELPAGLRAQLHAFAYREGHEQGTIHLAAFAALLHRYCPRPDFLVGVRQADRRHAGTEQLIGPFERELPWRADLAGDPPFRVLLDRVRADLRDSMYHAGAPLELPHPRLPGGLPAPRVHFVFATDVLAGVDWPGLRLRHLELADGCAPGQLTFGLAEHPGGATVRVEYDAAQYPDAQIQRLLGHYSVLLQAAVDRPDTHLGDLPLLSHAERRRLTEWNHTTVDFPRDATVQELIGARAAAAPDALAVTAPDGALFHADLERQANQLARHLRRAGLRPANVVGVLLESTTDLPVCLLALLRASGTGLWLDPRRPARDLARVIAATRPSFILTRSELLDVLPANSAGVLCVDRLRRELAALDGAPLVPVTGPDDPAFLVEAPVGDGAPGLAQWSQRALVCRVHAGKSIPGFRPDDNVLVTDDLPVAPLALQLLQPLACGARVLLAPRDTFSERTGFEAVVRSGRVTVACATPAMWQSLLGAGWTGAPTLRLISAGAPLAPALAARLKGCGRECWNLHGNAETVGGCLALPLHAKSTAPASALGRPLPNVQAHVLDARLQPVPVGLPGELYIGGEALAHGYPGDPARTIQRFILDPFRHLPGARLFRTGDLAVRSPHGEIVLVGRAELPPAPEALPRPASPLRRARARRPGLLARLNDLTGPGFSAAPAT